ncbi:MAG: hypothetical protein AAF567_07755 [Actinomycetota bacterium]
MSHTKRGTAITGDLFTLQHPSLVLDAPFTSFVDVVFDGVTHQVLSTADRSAFNYANTTGQFAIGDLQGHIIESIDTVDTQATHRYQAVLSGSSGALAVHTYLGSAQAVDLLAALRPVATPLGMALDPSDGAEIVTAPKVAVTTAIGVLEVSPLTGAIDAQLPRWQGTIAPHGQLYAGRIGDEVPWLTLVTRRCRVAALLGADVDPDHAATILALLDANWTE